MKRNSWHYKMAVFANESRPIHDDELSICQYMRKVAWGALAVGVLTGILIGLVGFTVLGCYQLLGALFGFAELGSVGLFFAAFMTIVGALLSYAFGKELWAKKSVELLKEDNQGFAAKAYKSYKEKVCFSVVFHD